ncbi:hypothetical protein [Paenibacillus daejeonensis]|nr:hypothetical protein [Paenibacillus daejeonensis]
MHYLADDPYGKQDPYGKEIEVMDNVKPGEIVIMKRGAFPHS